MPKEEGGGEVRRKFGGEDIPHKVAEKEGSQLSYAVKTGTKMEKNL